MTLTERRSRLPAGITTALGMLWLALFPLWQDGSYSHITRSKWIGMLALTGVTAVAFLLMLLLTPRRALRRKLRLGWLHAATLAYFGLVALSAAFGSWADCHNDAGQLTVLFGARRYEGLITQGCYGLIFLCMSLTRVRLRWVLNAAAVTLLLYAGVVALQYAGVNVLGLFPTGTSIRTNYEFQGTIGNIDMVVGYVSIVMALLLGAFVRLERPNGLWLLSGLTGVMLMLLMEVQSGLIAVALLLFALGLTALRFPDSRWRVLVSFGGALMMVSVRQLIGLPWLDGTEEVTLLFTWRKLLPAAAGLLPMCLAPLVRKHPGRPLGWKTVTAAAAGLIVLVLLAVYLVPLPAGNGLWELQEILHGRAQDAYGSERIGIWRLTLEMCRENLLWGMGPDTFLYAMEHHMYQTGQSLVQRFDNPHNMVLGVLAGSGLPAAAMFLVLTGGALLCGLRRAGQDRLLLPLVLAALCYLAQGMFTFSICLVTPMFWAALGMLTGQTMERKEDRDESDSQLCVPPQGDGGDQAGDAGADCGGAAGDAAGAGQLHGDAADGGQPEQVP